MTKTNGTMKTTKSTTARKDNETMKATKRLKQAQEQTQKAIAKTTEQITTATATDSIINQKAVECMTEYIKNGEHSNEYGKKIIELSTIICHCRLNKLMQSDETFRPEFVTLKNDITISSKYFQMLEVLESLYITRYNSNGDLETICTDKAREKEIYKQIANLTGLDGSDLVSVCNIALLNIVNKAKENKTICKTTLLDTFLVYNLTSKTYRNGTVKPKELWTQKATNGIREASAQVTRAITANRAIKEQTALYTAIETTYTNENGEQETATRYRKAPLLSAYEITDINGKQTAIVSNEQRKIDFETIPQRANLTARESYILKWVYEGFSEYQTTENENGEKVKTLFVGCKTLEQIADEWKIEKSTIYTMHRRMLDKLIKSGIFADIPLEPIKNEQSTEKAVKCYRMTENGEKQYITTYPSIKTASEKLKICRADIRRTIKGERKTAKGLVFEYDN